MFSIVINATTMIKGLLRPECDKACVSISNLGVRAAKLSAGHELKRAENSKKRVKYVKCVGCIISPLYSRAVILCLFFRLRTLLRI